METNNWNIVEKGDEYTLMCKSTPEGKLYARSWHDGTIEIKLDDVYARTIGYPSLNTLLKGGCRNQFILMYGNIPEWITPTESGIEVYKASLPIGIKEKMKDIILNHSTLIDEDVDFKYYNCLYEGKTVFSYLDKMNEFIYYDADEMVCILNLGENFNERMGEDVVLDSISEWGKNNPDRQLFSDDGLFFQKEIGGKLRWIAKM